MRYILTAIFIVFCLSSTAQIQENIIRMDSANDLFLKPYRDKQLIRIAVDSNLYTLTHAVVIGQSMQTVFDSGWYKLIGVRSGGTSKIDTLYITDSIYDLRVKGDTLWINDTAYGYSGDVNLWTQSGGKLYPTTATDDIVANDSLRVEGASLFKGNFTVTSANIANVLQIDGTTGQVTVSDSTSAWGPTPSYSTKHMIYNSNVELADGVSITFFAGVHGWGQISAHGGVTYAEFRFTVEGEVTLLSDCTVGDVSATDVAGDLCIYNGGNNAIIIKNSLGLNEGFLIEIHYGSTIFP